MSYFEYKDLKEKAQKNKNCSYKLYVLDVKGSRNIEDIGVRFKLIRLHIKTKIDVQALEKEKHQHILVDDSFIKNESSNLLNSNTGIVYGDMMYFCIYNNSITKNEFQEIVKQNMLNLDCRFDLHFTEINFETFDIRKSNEMFYVEDAINFANNEKNYDNDISINDSEILDLNK